MNYTLQPDHRFTLLMLHHGLTMTVIADWRAPCWKREPQYTDSWGSVLYFNLDWFQEVADGCDSTL